MPIPDYQSIMLPILKLASDQKEHYFRDAIKYISDLFDLSDEERRRKLPSGYDIIINNRVGWARTYLKKAGLLEDPKRGYFKITQKGTDVLNQNPSEINVKFLMQFPEFVEFQYPKKKEGKTLFLVEEKEKLETPQELIETGYKQSKESLAQELLEKLRIMPPEFFEKVIVDLLKKMGYGEGEVTGGPGDGGIDGIIYQDPLKIDKIYLQAKRYSENNIIGSNAIRNFIGTLETKGATKGVFITTSKFHSNVNEIISMTHKDIVIVDGEEVVELMIEYGVGIETDEVYEIKKIDVDYFEE